MTDEKPPRHLRAVEAEHDDAPPEHAPAGQPPAARWQAVLTASLVRLLFRSPISPAVRRIRRTPWSNAALYLRLALASFCNLGF